MEPEADDTADEKKEEEDDGKPKLTLGGLMQVTSREGKETTPKPRLAVPNFLVRFGYIS